MFRWAIFLHCGNYQNLNGFGCFHRKVVMHTWATWGLLEATVATSLPLSIVSISSRLWRYSTNLYETDKKSSAHEIFPDTAYFRISSGKERLENQVSETCRFPFWARPSTSLLHFSDSLYCFAEVFVCNIMIHKFPSSFTLSLTNSG